MKINEDYFSAGLGTGVAVLLILFMNRIKKAVLYIFGGSLDKMEFAGICFLLLLTYMVIKEAEREHEWHLFNELYVFFIAGGAMTGLGLGKVLTTIKHIKGGSSTTVEETHSTQVTKTEDVKSEVPK